jgi:hypothetical protein
MKHHGYNTKKRRAWIPEDSDPRSMNELDTKMMCPRCKKAVPVFIRMIESWDRFGKNYKKEAHCFHCFLNRHKEGSYIRDFGR